MKRLTTQAVALVIVLLSLFCSADANKTGSVEAAWPKLTKPCVLDLKWTQVKAADDHSFSFTLTYWNSKRKRTTDLVFTTVDSFKRFISTLPKGAHIIRNKNKSTGRPDFTALGIRDACKKKGVKFTRPPICL